MLSTYGSSFLPQGQAPPRLDGLALSAPLVIRSGDPAVITIETSGIPAPVVTWLLGNKEIKLGSGFQLTQQGSQYTLAITRVGSDLQKKGLFVVARNTLGEVKRQVDLQVYRGKGWQEKKISWDLYPSCPFPMSNRFEILYSARQSYCRARCKFSKWLDKCEISYGQMRLRQISV